MRVGKDLIIALFILSGLGLLVLSSFFIDYRDIASKATAKKQPIQVTQPQSQPKVLAEDTIKLAAAGDFDAQEQFSQSLVTINKEHPSATLALGDLSYGKISEQKWCNQVNSILENAAFELVPGNHDIEAKSQIDKFSRCLPNRLDNIVGSYPDRYYFDLKKTVRAVVISPAVAIDNNPNAFKVGSEEYIWLDKALSDAALQNIRWVIVAMHKNCLTVGEKKCEIGQDLSDLLIKRKVDLILQGHEHGYMRSNQLAVGKNCPNILPERLNPDACVIKSADSQYARGNGSLLAIVGTGGAEIRDINLASKNINLFDKYFGKNTTPVYGVLMLEITNNKLSAQLKENKTGLTKDTFSISYQDKNL